ncbi:MAG: glycosyltransferase [Chromatiales bacterium]|nr:glycosyltransferase [Chromatiales bacterium]
MIRQENAGPGGARNRGLDTIGDRGVVAFLDSDDEWMPDHLARAVLALQSGCDVYGSNWKPLGDYADALAMPVRQSLRLTPAEILPEAGLIIGDPLISEMTAPMCKLSGLVYRADRFPGLRFDPRYRHASEDVMFIYRMMLEQPRVMISTRVEVRSGVGVNIYESAQWGQAVNLLVLFDQTRAAKQAVDLVSRHPEAGRFLSEHLSALRAGFASNVWHTACPPVTADRTVLPAPRARSKGVVRVHRLSVRKAQATSQACRLIRNMAARARRSPAGRSTPW